MEELVEGPAQLAEEESVGGSSAVRRLLQQARELADELAARPNLGLTTLPE